MSNCTDSESPPAKKARTEANGTHCTSNSSETENLVSEVYICRCSPEVAVFLTVFMNAILPIPNLSEIFGKMTGYL